MNSYLRFKRLAAARGEASRHCRSKFFDRVQHDVLVSRIRRKVCDKRLLSLIGKYLRAGVMVEGVLHATTEGTPQGGPLSPLLANILLDDLDKELEHRGLPFVRYADDFVIFTKSLRSAQRVFHSMSRYLTDHLRLVVNSEKSRVVDADGVALCFCDGAWLRLQRPQGDDQRVVEECVEVQASHQRADRP